MAFANNLVFSCNICTTSPSCCALLVEEWYSQGDQVPRSLSWKQGEDFFPSRQIKMPSNTDGKSSFFKKRDNFDTFHTGCLLCCFTYYVCLLKMQLMHQSKWRRKMSQLKTYRSDLQLGLNWQQCLHAHFSLWANETSVTW